MSNMEFIFNIAYLIYDSWLLARSTSPSLTFDHVVTATIAASSKTRTTRKQIDGINKEYSIAQRLPPELLHHIFTSITRTSPTTSAARDPLAGLPAVCRSWYNSATEVLYSNINISSAASLHRLVTRALASERGPTLGSLVRVLKVTNGQESDLQDLFSACSKLEAVEYETRTLTASARLWEPLFAPSISLRRLVIRTPEREKSSYYGLPELRIHPRLEEVTLVGFTIADPLVFPPTVRSLTLVKCRVDSEVGKPIYYHDYDRSTNANRDTDSHVEELHLFQCTSLYHSDGYNIHIDELALAPLKKLTIAGCEGIKADVSLCSKLESLGLSPSVSPHLASEDSNSSTKPSYPNLSSLSYFISSPSDISHIPATFRAFLASSESLQSIKLQMLCGEKGSGGWKLSNPFNHACFGRILVDILKMLRRRSYEGGQLCNLKVEWHGNGESGQRAGSSAFLPVVNWLFRRRKSLPSEAIEDWFLTDYIASRQ